jgi:hypothetical protein
MSSSDSGNGYQGGRGRSPAAAGAVEPRPVRSRAADGFAAAGSSAVRGAVLAAAGRRFRERPRRRLLRLSAKASGARSGFAATHRRRS